MLKLINSPRSESEPNNSWEEQLVSQRRFSLSPAKYPYLTEFCSCYLPAYDGPNVFEEAITEFVISHDPAALRSLGIELAGIFPEQRASRAMISEPLFAEGILENYLALCGAKGKYAAIPFFKALTFIVISLCSALPYQSYLPMKEQNYSFGLSALSLFIENSSKNSTTHPAIDSSSLRIVANSLNSPQSFEISAINRVLLDLRSLYSVESSSPNGSYIRWNCSESGLSDYLSSKGAHLKARAGQILMGYWNDFTARRKEIGPSLQKPLLPLISDNIEADKQKLLLSLQEQKQKMFNVLTES